MSPLQRGAFRRLQPQKDFQSYSNLPSLDGSGLEESNFSQDAYQLQFLDAPVNSELADFVAMTREILDRYPEILTRVEQDQINHALAKKQARLEGTRHLESLSRDLPGMSDQLQAHQRVQSVFDT